MRIAVTGATGFLGRYVINHLTGAGHDCRCWYRPASDRSGFRSGGADIDWIPGELGKQDDACALVEKTSAVVHAALYRPGAGFRGAEGDVLEFVEKNVSGSLMLIEAARRAGVGRFVFIATCAVHEVILEDRKLDESHPLWPTSHYGAHKAALEKFIHSYGLGQGYDICSLRPTGIYGLAHPPAASRWFELVRQVKRGEPVRSRKGGKEVHAADVAKAVGVLLEADGVAGQAYNCYDHYVSEQRVAQIAKELSGSSSDIADLNSGPKHQIDTQKLRALGMEFGGEELLRSTIAEMLEHV
ncbi:MAG: NAD(P)-dependent oxidoreductase [bacterium]|nr:NAD(P)-dependent oxidoreductase [bacterium]